MESGGDGDTMKAGRHRQENKRPPEFLLIVVVDFFWGLGMIVMDLKNNLR